MLLLKIHPNNADSMPLQIPHQIQSGLEYAADNNRRPVRFRLSRLCLQCKSPVSAQLLPAGWCAGGG
jgi:hypothetical protein